VLPDALLCVWGVVTIIDNHVNNPAHTVVHNSVRLCDGCACV
jgi:hypothetical protein